MAGKLAHNGILFNKADNASEVAHEIIESIQTSPTTASDNPFSEVYITKRVAKEYGSRDLTTWIGELNDETTVAVVMVLKDIKLWLSGRGTDYVTWDQLQGILNNNSYITKNKGASNRLNDTKSFSEIHFFQDVDDSARRRELTAWLKDVFHRAGEQNLISDSILIQTGALDGLIHIASECGSSMSEVQKLFGTTQSRVKVMDISILYFPNGDDSNIKVLRVTVYTYYQGSSIGVATHTEAGFEVEFDRQSFMVNSAAISTKYAAQASAKLADESVYDF